MSKDTRKWKLNLSSKKPKLNLEAPLGYIKKFEVRVITIGIFLAISQDEESRKDKIDKLKALESVNPNLNFILFYSH